MATAATTADKANERLGALNQELDRMFPPGDFNLPRKEVVAAADEHLAIEGFRTGGRVGTAAKDLSALGELTVPGTRRKAI